MDKWLSDEDQLVIDPIAQNSKYSEDSNHRLSLFFRLLAEPLETYMTSEIADKLDWSRRSAYNVPSRLRESDEIRKKKPEVRRVIWIRTE